MNKLIKTPLASLVALSAFFTSHIHAGEALQQINAKVEKTAAQIEQDHGVLLTSQERNHLKITLVADKVSQAQPALSVKEKTETAIQTYEISDPVDQRRLLIELKAAETNLSGGGGGDDPK